EALEKFPDSDTSRYFLAALRGTDPPRRAPVEYVIALFEECADTFEGHLVEDLHYRVPDLIHDAVITIDPRDGRDVLDLGCGTGLCGQRFRPISRQLVGIDVCPGMLEQSRLKGVYDQLHRCDIVDAMNARPR